MISVIVPTYNEEHFIASFLDNVLQQDVDQTQVEIIISDGRSTDRTREIVATYQTKYNNIVLIDNPDKYVPQALNKALAIAKGETIVRLDAHSIYPKNYIRTLVLKLHSLQADNVGGMWITEPGNQTLEAAAIAIATTDKIGIGNASYRHGAASEIETDTVPYGCFKKDIFTRIGTFDEDLLRNQDDEFNGRIIKNNGKIFLIPEVKIRYFARPTYAKMRTMFYQYGLYKPLVMLKLGSPATMRQFAPPMLVLGHSIAAFFMLLFPSIWWFFGSGLLAYYLLLLFRATQITQRLPAFATQFSRLKLILKIFLAFPQIHFSYGMGYIKGWMEFVVLKKHLKNSSASLKENR
ncbi:MAG: glycosyltransferase family 2 protein [Flavobacteriales bacterium]